MMKVLLFGKNGQLGNELDKRADDFGFEIVSFGREEADITDYEKVNSLIEQYKPNIIINASAYHVVPECESHPETAFLINAVALKNLAETCDRLKIKLVHYSTDYVFDGRKEIPYKEIDTPMPLQIYGISKLAGEFTVLRYATNSVLIRTSGVYGGKTGSRAKKGNFIINILKQAEGKETLEVSSEQIVSPTYAVDLAKATLQLLKHKNVAGIYHLVNEGYCSWAELAQAAVDVKGLKTKIIPVDRGGMAGSLRRPLFSALSNTRAKKLKIVLPEWEDAARRYVATLD
jgi:dTDP-4-dehydrorhamnose reductase